ncbi:circadian clock protein KaiC [Actinoplanes sp. SE50]|uniref:RAD55 family ATPase n=1 Tax=unclassified Actinoplanes TaxID=2626549 RepID=UPI00023ED050|nr:MULTISPECIES: ATPase domain-containing protein [unclassified Actinoplanes]AEV83854.1 circadian clock protein KaiC [Actinoplanes sp. SE50/110]ATO82002.1 circadian clock protein KaiC [Actinoplanes sp. SE50]SLL99410.1 circadian clock protein KaiC [Actinoplanes sp. SE50/110]
MTHLSTGHPDLDLILGGGLRRGSVVVLAGPPGTGKTVLAQQICFAVATGEHKAIYYTTLSEPHAKLVEHLHDFTFFDAGSLGPRVEYVHLGDMLRGHQAAGLDPVIDEVVRKALDDEPALLVVDSTMMLRDFVSDRALRTSLYDLTSRVAHSGAVLLLLGEYSDADMQSGIEFTLADGIIALSHQIREPVDRRTLRVIKMRGAAPLGGAHTLHITDDGIRVYPRIESFLPTDMPGRGARISSGIPGLDDLMGGGIPDGDGTVVLGPTGVGKTIGCLSFLAEGLAQGQRCLYVTFQDTVEELKEMAGRFGWDFAAAEERDQLVIAHVPVGALDLDLDVLSSMIRHSFDDGSVRRVVIDSLAEMAHAAREAQRFPAYLRSMLAVVRSAGASLWVTSETQLFGHVDDPLTGLMYLFHNVIQVRYIEECAAAGRFLNVVKMRNSRHDNAMYRCHIADQGGLTVGERLEQATGLLGWDAPRNCLPPGRDS